MSTICFNYCAVTVMVTVDTPVTVKPPNQTSPTSARHFFG